MNYTKQQMGFLPIAVAIPATKLSVASVASLISKSKAIVSKIAPLVQNIFASKAKKEALAQKAQYDQANQLLRTEISTLDSTMSQLKVQGDQISAEMQRAGVNGLSGFDGLGNIFRKIIDKVSGKTKAVAQVNTAKQQFEALSKERDNKLAAIDQMIQQLDQLQKRLEDAISTRTGGNTGLLVGVGVLAAIGIYAATKSN